MSPVQFKKNDILLSESEACDAFAEFFDKKVLDLCCHFDDKRFEFVKDDIPIQISLEVLDRAISKIKPKKSSGPDNVPMLILKDSAGIYRFQLLSLFNKILADERLPEIWKTAHITPVHKKGAIDNIMNYRPVSGLCSVSKLFERCIMEIMGDTSNLEGSHQHGFRSNHSTVTAMLEIQSIIAKELDNNRKVLVYSTDLTAAFDLLRPGIMLQRLVGVLPYKICKILHEFLIGHSFSVKLGDSLSKNYKMPVGCAQGSTLGPRLFSMYCGGLRDVIKDDLVAYADDAYVLISGVDNKSLITSASVVMDKHVKWLESIGMVVNVGKTEAVLFSKHYEPPVTLTVGNTSFDTTQSMNILGVTFDAQLNWNQQVDKVLDRAKRAMNGLRILQKSLRINKFVKILTSQFFSKIYYGSPVWLSSLTVSNLKRIESIHYRALRLCYHDYKCQIARDIIDHDLCRANPSEWKNYTVASEMIRIFNSGSPVRLYTRLLDNSYVIHRPDRIRFFSSSHTKIGDQSFENKVVTITSMLDFDWHFNPPSKDSLRIRLKNCLFKFPSSAVSFSVLGLEKQLRARKMQAHTYQMNKIAMKKT